MNAGARGRRASGEDVPMVEGHLTVPRTARYAMLDARVAPPQEVWWVLHGYRQLAPRFLRRFAPLADGSRRIVAPEGLSRFYVDPGPGRHGPEARVGASWMTRVDRLAEIRDYVAYLDRLRAHLRGGDAPETVLGFSQGVATAVRWVVQGEVRPLRLVLWGDTLPPDVDPGALGAALVRTEVILVRGTADAAIEEDRADEERARFARAGLAPRVLSYDGGHEIHTPTLLELARGDSPGSA